MTNGKLAILAVLAATTMSTSAMAQKELSMWARNTSEAFMPALVEAYNKSHENKIDLQIIPSREMVQKYATAAAGGSAPDFVSLDLVYTPAFAASGQVEDLTELAESLPYFEHLSKGHLGTATYDGRIYGLPMSADASILLWNKGLFKKAGLDPEKAPTTWDEVIEYAGKVDALGDPINGFYFPGACGGCNAFTFMPLVWASGGEILVDDGKTATLDSPQMRDAIAFYRQIIENDYIPEGAKTDPGSNFFGGFANGNAGIAPGGSFAIGNLVKNYPDVEFGVTFLPGKDGGKGSFAGGDNFLVTAGRDNLDAAKDFMEFVYSIEGQTLLAEGGSLPTRGDTAAEAVKNLDERYLVAVEAMEFGKTPVSTVYNDLFNSSTGPWKQMLLEVFFGEDVDGSLKAAQDSMQSIIDFAN